MAVFLVQLVTLFLIGKAGLRVFVGKVVGVDFVERGGQGFFKIQLGTIHLRLYGFIFPFHGLPIKERQIDGGRTAQHGDIERTFRFIGRRTQTCAQSNRRIPTAFLRVDRLLRRLQAVFGGAQVGAVGQNGNRYVQVHAFDRQQVKLCRIGGHVFRRP